MNTECYDISNFQVNQNTHWKLSSDDETSMDPNFFLEYQIRANEISFELPYFKINLKSGDDLIEMCGPIVYTIELH